MGCDIHIYTEQLKEVASEQRWINIDNWRYNQYYGHNNTDPLMTCKEIYEGRDYSMFAMLADVRNYNEITPLSKPRGLPYNVSGVIYDEYCRWNSGAHSCSYATLAEIKEYNNSNRIMKYSGYVSPEDEIRIDNGDMPFSWCQGTNLPYNYRTWEHEHDHLTKLISALEERKKDVFWIWDEEEHPEYDDKIRIVFWFDN